MTEQSAWEYFTRSARAAIAGAAEGNEALGEDDAVKLAVEEVRAVRRRRGSIRAHPDEGRRRCQRIRFGCRSDRPSTSYRPGVAGTSRLRCSDMPRIIGRSSGNSCGAPTNAPLDRAFSPTGRWDLAARFAPCDGQVRPKADGQHAARRAWRKVGRRERRRHRRPHAGSGGSAAVLNLSSNPTTSRRRTSPSTRTGSVAPCTSGRTGRATSRRHSRRSTTGRRGSEPSRRVSSMVLTMAVVEPMIRAAGIDGIRFGIFIVIVVEMDRIAPPSGSTCSCCTGHDPARHRLRGEDGGADVPDYGGHGPHPDRGAGTRDLAPGEHAGRARRAKGVPSAHRDVEIVPSGSRPRNQRPCELAAAHVATCGHPSRHPCVRLSPRTDSRDGRRVTAEGTRFD